LNHTRFVALTLSGLLPLAIAFVNAQFGASQL